MEILRTPDHRFHELPDFPYRPKYAVVKGLRMHYVRHGKGDPILCLHGEPSWSYLYRKMIPTLAQQGTVYAPDLLGFGRSDKPVNKTDYTFDFHYETLTEFVENLDLKGITLVCQDWGGLLGLTLAANQPERFARLCIMNTFLPTGAAPMPEAFLAWRQFAKGTKDMDVGRVLQSATTSELPPEVVAAYDAPFPDATFKAGAHAFPLLVPIAPQDPGADAIAHARETLAQWTKPTLIMFSDNDPIMVSGDQFFRSLIPAASKEPAITITQAGHFLQEDKGEEIAQHIIEFIQRNPA